MTRINTEPPHTLTDAHLFAEIRELPRVWRLSRTGPVPPTYRLGAGHVLFFRDKRRWLAARHAELVTEWLSRGFQLGEAFRAPLPLSEEDPPVSWSPSLQDRAACLERMRERLLANSTAHRYGGEPVPLDFYGAA